MPPCLYHDSRNVNYRNRKAFIQITEKYFTAVQLLEMQKYNLHEYVITNYSNTNIQITEMHKYNLDKYFF